MHLYLTNLRILLMIILFEHLHVEITAMVSKEVHFFVLTKFRQLFEYCIYIFHSNVLIIFILCIFVF